MTNKTGSITKFFETWDCNDNRLPVSKELHREPPSWDFIQSLNEFQISPIGVIKQGKNYHMVWGRKRLLAARIGNETVDDVGVPYHHGQIDVLVITGIDPNDRAKWSALENTMRSDNPISLYEDMMNYFKHDKDATYKSVAVALGTTAGHLKALDKKFAKAPKWALNAALRGEIALSTVAAVAQMKPEIQEECKKDFQTDKKLTAGDVKEKKRFIQEEVYKDLMPALGLDVKQPRQFFTRDELIAVDQWDTWDHMHIAIQELLAQTE